MIEILILRYLYWNLQTLPSLGWPGCSGTGVGSVWELKRMKMGDDYKKMKVLGRPLLEVWRFEWMILLLLDRPKILTRPGKALRGNFFDFDLQKALFLLSSVCRLPFVLTLISMLIGMALMKGWFQRSNPHAHQTISFPHWQHSEARVTVSMPSLHWSGKLLSQEILTSWHFCVFQIQAVILTRQYSLSLPHGKTSRQNGHRPDNTRLNQYAGQCFCYNATMQLKLRRRHFRCHGLWPTCILIVKSGNFWWNLFQVFAVNLFS